MQLLVKHRAWKSIITSLVRYDTKLKQPFRNKTLWKLNCHHLLEPLRAFKTTLILLKHLIKNGAKRCIEDAHEHEHVLQQELDASEALINKFDIANRTTLRSLLKSVWGNSKNILEILNTDKERRSSKQQHETAKQLSSK